MILESNKSCIELMALYVHPKNSTGNHLRSHLRAIMALAHSRLGVENKSGRIFAFDKFTLQNLANKSGCVKTNLLYFLYITSEVKEYYEALFLSYRPQTIGSQFHNFSRQIAFIHYSGPSKYAPAGLIFDRRQICKEILKELRFNIIKNLLCLFFIDSL